MAPRVKKGAHLRDECTWHFPGEPPSQRAVIGKVGHVAKPWDLNDPDPECAAAARMLAQWQQDSQKVYTLGDLPEAKRRKVEALSPGTTQVLQELLRTASLEGVGDAVAARGGA